MRGASDVGEHQVWGEHQLWREHQVWGRASDVGEHQVWDVAINEGKHLRVKLIEMMIHRLQ